MTGVQRGVPFEYSCAVKLYDILLRKAGFTDQEILAGVTISGEPWSRSWPTSPRIGEVERAPPT